MQIWKALYLLLKNDLALICASFMRIIMNLVVLLEYLCCCEEEPAILLGHVQELSPHWEESDHQYKHLNP